MTAFTRVEIKLWYFLSPKYNVEWNPFDLSISDKLIYSVTVTLEVKSDISSDANLVLQY